MQPAILGPPTLAGYWTFLQNEVQIPAAALSPTTGNAYAVPLSFEVAKYLVPHDLCRIAPDIYTICVYNVGMDRLARFCPDVPGQYYFSGSGKNGQPEGLRAQYKLGNFVAGVVSGSSDEGTSVQIAVPESLKNLSLLNLQMLATPWGNTYLSYASELGTLWGLSGP